MNLKPTGRNLICKKLPYENKTSLVLTDNFQKARQFYAEVLAVGPGDWVGNGERFLEPVIKVGDVIIWSKSSGEFETDDGEKVMLIHENFVLAVVEEKTE